MKNTKKSLIASGISLAVSVALLAGSTFAWFTDSVTNKGNKIQAGNLAVGLWQKTDTLSDDQKAEVPALPVKGDYTDISDSQTPVFGYDLWEPGYSEGAVLQVRNNGTLALKYELAFTGFDVKTGAENGGDASQDGNIAEVIDVYLLDEYRAPTAADTPAGTLAEYMAAPSAYTGELAPRAVSGDINIVVKMRETADNEYQNASVVFDIKLYATQTRYEKDGFGSDKYDADLPLMQVSGINEFKAAIENGGSVMLTDNIDAGSETGSRITVSADTTINGNGKTLSTQDPDKTAYGSRVIDMTGLENVTLTISELAIEGGTTAGQYPYLYRGISLYQNVKPTLNIANSSIKAGHYAINIASENQNASVSVGNSSASGYCAFQTHSADTKAVFTASTLTGVNQWSGEGNDFAAVVVNATAGDSVLTFNNCTIEANELKDAAEFFFSLRAGCTVNLNGCTFIKNGEKIPASEIFSDLQVTDDENNALCNDYVHIYGGTDINIIIDGEKVDLT